MRSILVILILLMLPLLMKSQNATATIESASTCAGDTVLVPVNVTDFNDVGAMTIFIGYDTNHTEFLSLENINPVIPGSMTVNPNNGQVGIAYSFIAGFTITNGKLFDLRYHLISDSSLLTFNQGTEIANTNLEVIPLETFDGGLYTNLTIVSQPDSVQAYPDTDVTFTVIASGNNIAYQWEENTGSGWVSLQNNSTYSGVDTETLTVHDVSLAYNGYLYRCSLSITNCSQYSEIALLEVNTTYPAATIGQSSSCPEQTVLEPVFVGDFLDVVEFTFNISFEESVLDFIALQNIHEDLQTGSLTTEPISNPNGISIHWEDTNPLNITSGKLFDMEFGFTGSSSSVAFINGTEVYNSQANLIDITLTNGQVMQHELPTISVQPENQTVKVNEEATFTVEASGVQAYQWQVSMDNGQNWTDLTNTIPYYNVTTNELTISPVTWELNNYEYACMLYGPYCEIRSDAGILSVDTLTSIGNDLPLSTRINLSPNPATNIAKLVYHCGGSCDTKVRIISLNGRVEKSIQSIQSTEGSNEITIDLSGITAGVYVVELQFEGKAGAEIHHQKLIKILN